MMKQEEFNQLDELLRSKTYDELSEKERSWVDQMVGQPHYDELQALVKSVAGEKERKVSRHVKADLVRAMRRKHRSALGSLVRYQLPAYSNLIVIALMVPLIWLLVPAKEIVVEKEVTVSVPVVETIEVQLPPDTVFVERRVEVRVPVYLTNATPEPKEKSQKEIKGRTFAEEKDLQELLVSGR